MWQRCENEKECKELFSKLAFRLHPDYGGSNELMILLTEFYEILKIDPQCVKILWDLTKNRPKEEDKNKKNNKYYEKTAEDIHYDPTDQRFEIIQEIYEYSGKHESFDKSFLEDVVEYIREKGYVTSGQYNALVKTYYAFRMNEK